jgi:hypothetical protein
LHTTPQAAIDVVGAQAGKSGGSVLQQALLLLSAGAIGPTVPVLFLCYVLMLRGWNGSVAELSRRRRYTQHSPLHTVEEDGWPEAAGADGAVVAAPPRPAGFGARAPGPLDADALAARLRELADSRGPPGGAPGGASGGAPGGAGPGGVVGAA